MHRIFNRFAARVTIGGIIVLIMLALTGFGQSADASRLKDLVSIKGVRSNQLVGYGLVVGLEGSGDKAGTEFTIQSLVNMLERMGINVDQDDVKVKNVAAVMVTAKMPPFARVGSRIDVVVSSIGDAKSLYGGTLLMTPLKGVDNRIYALAQGPLGVGGIAASGEAGGGVSINHALVGRIAKGASVEREIPIDLNGKDAITLALHNPDFTTAIRMSETINKAIGSDFAQAIDSATLQVKVPVEMRDNVTRFIAQIEPLDVVPDMIAKIVVNEKTGTVVIGEHVRISTVAVSHGLLSISIKENQNVSQPGPYSGFTDAETVVTQDTDIQISAEENKVLIVPGGSTIGELVRALNAIGVGPRGLIAIFQSIKAAGALQAEIEII